jgi:hypothetical protein
MPAPLLTPHVPPGFPQLVTAGGPIAHSSSQIVPRTEAGGQTVSLGSQTTSGTEAGGPTMSQGSQTAPGIEAGGLIATPGGQIASSYITPSSPASPTLTKPHVAPTTLVMPHVTPLTPPMQCMASMSMILATPPMTPASQLYWRTTRVALGLRGSHRHHLYISSRHRLRPYRWLL